VGQTALLGVLTVAMTKRQAELLLPDAATDLALIGIKIGQAIGAEVDRFASRL
jgi:hypothetical protein